MENYLKPEIVAVGDLAEGVFAASGSSISGSGTNVSWSIMEEGMHDTSSHAAEEPHPIRKYSITIPADYCDKLLHFSVDFRGPIRHGGFHHQLEETVIRSGNHVEGDFKVSASNRKYIYVCIDEGTDRSAFDILSAAVTLK